MKVIADRWELEVIDVSKFGLGVKSPQCLAPGFKLECEVIGNIGEKLAKKIFTFSQLQSFGLEKIVIATAIG